jgi:DNA (cytosine-5)-methyltransferase 1
MSAYYNEIDPYAAQWLRNLIAAGHIAPGDVDERSIVDVRPDDLKGYTQCHFFAGIGGWSYALRLAGWADDRPVWTGSCPCQPLSSAGQRKGHADERHLWPAFLELIAERQPSMVFGEQVASKDGREWFSAVRADLEGVGYACGAADLCAAGVGAPHIRQRLYWVGMANADYERQSAASVSQFCDKKFDAEPRSCTSGLADAEYIRQHRGGTIGAKVSAQCWRAAVEGYSDIGSTKSTSPPDSFWRDADWLWCRDERWRPVEPGTFPLAHGVSGRVGRLRAYGNAIVPQVAAALVETCM